MLRKSVRWLFLFLVTSSFLARGAVPEILQWGDLMHHPERWPAMTTVKKELQFSQSRMDEGTQVKVYNVLPNEVELIAPEGFIFSQKPNECTLLADANSFWSSLTPEQKEVTWQKIVNDRTLWPGKITLPSGAQFTGLTLEPGTEATFVYPQSNKVQFAHPKSDSILSISQAETDVFSRARDIARLPVEERQGVLRTVLDESLVDVHGQPFAAAPAKYYIVYYAASTCPRCKIFSPKFVDYYNAKLADRDDVRIVVWSTERPKTNIQKYMHDHKMPWATINDREAGIAGFAIRKAGTVTQIPAILVLDRFGNELLSSRTTPSQTIASAEVVLTKLDDVLSK